MSRAVVSTKYQVVIPKGVRNDLGLKTGQNLSGGQRQGVAVARAAAWGRRVVIMDEPTAALGVKETGQVVEVIGRRGVITLVLDQPLSRLRGYLKGMKRQGLREKKDRL